MKPLYYKLDANNQPVPAREFPSVDDRRVGWTVVGDRVVSTVFLAIDHAFGGGPPVLWETMVFPWDGNRVLDYDELGSERYSSHADAVEGHARWVAAVREGATGGA